MSLSTASRISVGKALQSSSRSQATTSASPFEKELPNEMEKVDLEPKTESSNSVFAPLKNHLVGTRGRMLTFDIDIYIDIDIYPFRHSLRSCMTYEIFIYIYIYIYNNPFQSIDDRMPSSSSSVPDQTAAVADIRQRTTDTRQSTSMRSSDLPDRFLALSYAGDDDNNDDDATRLKYRDSRHEVMTVSSPSRRKRTNISVYGHLFNTS
jgi:hypothetical protein